MERDLQQAATSVLPELTEQEGEAPSLLSVLGLYSHYIALLAAWIATCGSLFFSEVLRWTPCLLCWYQRILMYPLAIILATGLLRRDRKLSIYVLPFSLIGVCVSLYHYLLQKTTWFPPPACTIGVPCTTDYINWFGFITIPFLALTAFLIISLMMVVSILMPTSEAVEPAAQGAGGIERFGFDRAATLAIIGIVIVWFVVAAQLI